MRVFADDGEAVRDVFRIELAGTHHVHPADDGRQGRAQFVRERGEKFVFGAVGFLRAAIETRVINGERGAAREFDAEREIVFGVVAAESELMKVSVPIVRPRAMAARSLTP